MKRIRTSHPFTQPQLAEYLLVSRDQVAKYEAKQRNLPQKAREKLARLEIALAKNKRTLSTAAALRLQQLAEEEKEALEDELVKLQYSLHLVTTKLNGARRKYEKAMQALWIIPVLFGQLSEGKEGTFEKKWLQATEAGILKKMKSYSLGTQQLLQFRQSALQKQVKDIQALLASYKKEKTRKRSQKVNTTT